MKNSIVIVAMLIAAVLLGLVVGRSWPTAANVAPPASEARQILYWVAPMDAEYRRDEPGLSPMGMELVPVYANEIDGEAGVIAIDPTLENNLGVRTGLAVRGTLSRRVETVGYISYDEDTLQHVHTRVEGWIETLVATASGDPVKKGQLLFELYSPTLVNAQQEYLVALNSNNALLRDASRQRLLALGVTAGEIAQLDKERKVRQRVRVFAQSDGVIAHLGVREGIYVTPATEIMSVAQLDKVWVLAEVFERQAGWVSAGQEATVELDYLPGTTLRGTVDYVYPELDPQTRTLRVRLRFDNESLSLRPNMFARVAIQGAPINNIVHIPREAVIRSGSSNRVVVAMGDGRYRSQRVLLGIEADDRIAIRRGLEAGDRVVTSAQFLIDSESNVESALERMETRP